MKRAAGDIAAGRQIRRVKIGKVTDRMHCGVPADLDQICKIMHGAVGTDNAKR